MKKLTILFFLVIPLIASCTKEEVQEFPSEYYSYDAILGQWYVADNEYYEFKKNATYIHTKNNRVLEQGDFLFNKEHSTILCKTSKGEYFTVAVSFIDNRNAIFNITKNGTNEKINVERK